MPESKEKTRADRLARKATTTGGLHLGRSEMLRSLRHYLARGHYKAKDITPSVAWRTERGVERGKRSSTVFLERTRKSHRQSDQYVGTVSKATLGENS